MVYSEKRKIKRAGKVPVGKRDAGGSKRKIPIIKVSKGGEG